MSDETLDPRLLEELSSVYAMIMAMTDQMANVAWAKMGLQPHPLTGKTEADLDEAKVAVDVTAGLAAFLEGKLDDADKRRIHNLVHDLRINFVQQKKRAEEGQA